MIDNCFSYDERKYAAGPYEYFQTFPVINFNLNGLVLTWYPSEYLYRSKSDKYCFAAEAQSSNELLLGGTLMRQHNFVFDLERNLVGIAHAQCSNDSNQIIFLN